jgi:hypothetical protein
MSTEVDLIRSARERSLNASREYLTLQGCNQEVLRYHDDTLEHLYPHGAGEISPLAAHYY